MIYILIPVYNRIAKTINCIDSIVKEDKQNLQIIVIDDNSSDGTKQTIHEKYPEVIVLNGTGSLFWTGAVSYGIDYVLSICEKGDWVLLLNNDVQITEGVLKKLINFSIRKNRNVLVNALSVDLGDKKTIIKSGTIIKSWFFNITKHVYHNDKISNIKSNDPVEVDLLTGRCLLHPVEVFLSAGNYNSKLLPHYGGDDEFTVRAKKFGYDLYVLPSAVVYLENDRKCIVNNGLLEALFGVRSSLNIINKWRFAKMSAPLFSLPTYYLISIVKSLYIFFKLR